MICTSTLASCLRMANINSCLRIVEAFSTSFSSANANNSVGDFCCNSLSFISRIGGPLLRTIGLLRSPPVADYCGKYGWRLGRRLRPVWPQRLRQDRAIHDRKDMRDEEVKGLLPAFSEIFNGI